MFYEKYEYDLEEKYNVMYGGKCYLLDS